MSKELVADRAIEDAKQYARILYFAHGLTLFFSLGLLSFVPVIINYVMRPDTEGTLAHSHHTWMIRSFWIYVACVTVAILFALTFFGIPLAVVIWGCGWLWKAYRLIKGFVELNNNRAMPE